MKSWFSPLVDWPSWYWKKASTSFSLMPLIVERFVQVLVFLAYEFAADLAGFGQLAVVHVQQFV
jgi:hypothetical protein